jgi:hypothetical protein
MDKEWHNNECMGEVGGDLRKEHGASLSSTQWNLRAELRRRRRTSLSVRIAGDVSGRAEVAGPYRSPSEDLGGVGGRVADSVRRLRELRAESELLTRIGTETAKKGEEIEMTGRSHHPVTRRRT